MTSNTSQDDFPPLDPNAADEQAVVPHLPANPEPEPVPAVTQSETKEDKNVKGSLAGSTWTALIVGMLLLVVLLVFIVQNQNSVELTLFAWSFTLPAGVTHLLAAIVGALIMALVGGVRMFQLRRQVKKAKQGAL